MRDDEFLYLLISPKQASLKYLFALSIASALLPPLALVSGRVVGALTFLPQALMPKSDSLLLRRILLRNSDKIDRPSACHRCA